MNSKFISYIFKPLCFLFVFAAVFLTSCDNSDNNESPYVKGAKENTILIYAVASNSLVYNLSSDKSEILAAGKDIDLTKNNILVYEINYDYSPKLLQLAETDDGYEFKTVKEYDNEVTSLSAVRIREVLNDMENDFPALKYGLILWSHGTGADPYFNNPTRSANQGMVSETEKYSFGYDKVEESSSHYEMNIDALADALPDGKFHFIWFDACYMAGIETMYQLKNKSEYFVGYPTEVYEMGMPYDLVMPYLTKSTPDLKGGAKEFFDYYNENSNSQLRVATVVVTDLSKIERVADYCKEFYSIEFYPDVNQLQKYTRGSIGPFYDFGQYSRKMGEESSFFTEDEWNSVMNDFILYKAATRTDFNWNPINTEEYTGISSHIYAASSMTEKENYYRSLNWYKKVFE